VRNLQYMHALCNVPSSVCEIVSSSLISTNLSNISRISRISRTLFEKQTRESYESSVLFSKYRRSLRSAGKAALPVTIVRFFNMIGYIFRSIKELRARTHQSYQGILQQSQNCFPCRTQPFVSKYSAIKLDIFIDY